jgi:hypothetical protein
MIFHNTPGIYWLFPPSNKSTTHNHLHCNFLQIQNNILPLTLTSSNAIQPTFQWMSWYVQQFA